MIQKLVVILLLVSLVDSVRSGDAKEVVVSSARQLKGITAKRVIWKKDKAKMVLEREVHNVRAETAASGCLCAGCRYNCLPKRLSSPVNSDKS